VIVIVVGALAGVGAGIAIGLDEDEPEIFLPTSTTEAGVTTPPPAEQSDGVGNGTRRPEEPELPRTEDDPEGLEPGPSGAAPESSEEVAAADAARAYIEAIDARDGNAVCEAFSPGGLDEIELPAERSNCHAAIQASLGFDGKDGRPVWDSSQMTEDVSAQVEGDSARVVATVFTKYADVREPTIEDDIIYLSLAADGWLVLKPSATLYRAVGIADVPLSALQPPG